MMMMTTMIWVLTTTMNNYADDDNDDNVDDDGDGKNDDNADKGGGHTKTGNFSFCHDALDTPSSNGIFFHSSSTNIYYIMQSPKYVQNTFLQSGNDSKWAFKHFF